MNIQTLIYRLFRLKVLVFNFNQEHYEQNRVLKNVLEKILRFIITTMFNLIHMHELRT